MWNPFKKNKLPQPKFKVGELVLGYKFSKNDVWQAYGRDALGFIESVRLTEENKYLYVVNWLESGNNEKHYSEDILEISRKRYLEQYGT